jgi:hypothetical protein
VHSEGDQHTPTRRQLEPMPSVTDLDISEIHGRNFYPYPYALRQSRTFLLLQHSLQPHLHAICKPLYQREEHCIGF